MNSIKELVQACEKWTPNDVSFSEIVGLFIKLTGQKRKLADHVEVPIQTTTKWADGVIAPHPKLQKMVVAWIGKQLQEK
jgi:hypothetical protein